MTNGGMLNTLQDARGNEVKTIEARWEEYRVQSMPSLHHLQPEDRDDLELLDVYMRTCLEDFFGTGGHLDTCFIRLLGSCACVLARRLQKLDGEIQLYFEQLGNLSKLVLRQLNDQKTTLLLVSKNGDTSPLQSLWLCE
jgi:hypothetical protein